MTLILKHKVGHADKALGGASRITGLAKVLVGGLFFALLHNPVQVFSALPPSPSYSAALAWVPSPSTNVIGYRVYYGTASRNYTNSVVAGNVTTNTVTGLASGVIYFFAVTCYNTNGLESVFSNEVSFEGLPTVQIRVASNQQFVLTVSGLIGQTYDIMATQNFTVWTAIGTVTLGAGGSLDFTDTNAASFSKRFYRARQTP